MVHPLPVRAMVWILAIAFPLMAGLRSLSQGSHAPQSPEGPASHSHPPPAGHDEHGDADHQHDGPDSPYHDHDDHSHTSPGDGSIVGADLSRTAFPDALCATTIRDRVTILPILTAEFFHPPLA